MTLLGRRRLPRVLLVLALCAAGYFAYTRSSDIANFSKTHLVTRSFEPVDADPEHMHGKSIGVKNNVKLWNVKPMPPDDTFEQKREHHKGNCFNLARSDSLPLDRPIPDFRGQRCKDMVYPSELPDTSVVFVFFNEPASPLYRSIHSVLDRTPPHLLREIVLVDDGSDVEWLKEPFEEYLSTLPKIKLVRAGARQGLMKARSLGAEAASGETITFLDSHIEVNVGWLEPLLYRVSQDRRHVVMPIIDSIQADSFQYTMGGLDILGFSWSLGQKGIGTRPRTDFEPMPSPISEFLCSDVM